MKLVILVETPNDDDLHGPRIHRALSDYIACAQIGGSCIGSTGGPNRMVASNGVKVIEMRVDQEFILTKLGDQVPTFRGAWWRLCGWWLHSLLNPRAVVDIVEERADGSILFKSVRRSGDVITRF